MKRITQFLLEAERKVEWTDTKAVKKDGIFTFEDHPEFTPNIDPESIFEAGVMGGSYFYHPDISDSEFSKLKEKVKWLGKIDEEMIRRKVAEHERDKNVNKHKVYSGQPLSVWKEKGWIQDIDPYGWINWYCNFFEGRRSFDDDRQIKRWRSFVARHYGGWKRSKGAGEAQGLLQWAWDVEGGAPKI